jgi:anthranilate synthase component 1
MISFVARTKDILADMETPVSAFTKLCKGKRDSFLLESVDTSSPIGRYSIVGWAPVLELELSNERLTMRTPGGRRGLPARCFLDHVREVLGGLRIAGLPGLPCVGSLVGYVGYDAVRTIERLPPAKPLDLPVARLVLPSRYAIFDHMGGSLYLVEIETDKGTQPRGIEEMERALRTPLPNNGPGLQSVEMRYPPKERFLAAVSKAKHYIEEGEIFQVVISDVIEGRTTVDPFEIYRRLRVRSPSPYMFFLDYGRFHLVGASPETLVRVRDGSVMIRPIAGTRQRTGDIRRDSELESELLASEKERAEHLMLVDLARNDVGKVCHWGTVEVDPFMVVERFSHVMHIVSEVRGKLLDRADAVDAFAAAFPAGTVTGAPKIRAMEIIDELEIASRGPYGGAVGYFGPGDQLETCIAIRTVLFKGERFVIQAGAGIVADSDPEMEYGEILHKAAQSISAIRWATEGEP